MGNLIAGFHNAPVNGIFQHVAHKTTVNLEVIHWYCFQVGKRTQTHPKIIQCKFVAVLAYLTDKLYGIHQIINGSGFGDFKTDILRIDNVMFLKLLDIIKK